MLHPTEHPYPNPCMPRPYDLRPALIHPMSHHNAAAFPVTDLPSAALSIPWRAPATVSTLITPQMDVSHWPTHHLICRASRRRRPPCRQSWHPEFHMSSVTNVFPQPSYVVSVTLHLPIAPSIRFQWPSHSRARHPGFLSAPLPSHAVHSMHLHPSLQPTYSSSHLHSIL